jgi:hypothetical protein
MVRTKTEDVKSRLAPEPTINITEVRDTGMWFEVDWHIISTTLDESFYDIKLVNVTEDFSADLMGWVEDYKEETTLLSYDKPSDFNSVKIKVDGYILENSVEVQLSDELNYSSGDDENDSDGDDEDSEGSSQIIKAGVATGLSLLALSRINKKED